MSDLPLDGSVSPLVQADAKSHALSTGVILGGILAAGLILRWVALGSASLWYDEGFTWWVALQSPHQIIRIIQADTWPPLYYLIMHYWIAIFGDSETALRAESALASTLAVLLGIALAWRIFETRGARLLSAGLLSLSVMQIEFARDTRCYATASLLVLCVLYTIIRRIEGGKLGWLAGYILSAAALVYQHNVMWLYLACLHGAWLIWPGGQSLGKRLRDMILSDIVVAAIFAPWAPSLLHQFHQVGKAFWTDRPIFFDLSLVIGWVSGIDAEGLRAAAQRLHLFQDVADRIVRLPAFALVTAVILLVAFATRGTTRRRIWALLVCALGPIAIAFLYSQVRQSIFIDRVFTPTSALMPLAFGGIALLAAILWRRLGALAISLVLLLGFLGSIATITKPDFEPWRQVLTYIQQNHQPGDRMLLQAAEGELMYDYYVHSLGWDRIPTGGVPADFRSNDPPRVQLKITSDADLDGLNQRLSDPTISRLWFVECHVGWIDPDQRAKRYFDENWHRLDMKKWSIITVNTYDRK